MKELTAENVNETMLKCLFVDDEPKDNAVIVEGILHKFGFKPANLEANKEDIKGYLSQLPDEFQASDQASGGGGMSFLNACITKDGRQWGEHCDMEALFALGLACGLVEMPLPRSMWKVLPGGMPYYCVKKLD